MKKLKNIWYALAGTLMSTAALATPPAAKTGTGLTTDAAGNLQGIFGKILTKDNVEMIGGLITAIGVVIIIWKVTQLVFGSGTWSDEVKMVMGGLIVMIVGTNFLAVMKMIVPGMATAWT